MSKNDRGTSALQRIQELCRAYDSSIPSYSRSVQGEIRDAPAAFASSGVDEAYLEDPKESYATEEVESEKPLAACKETLADAVRRVEELQHIKYSLDDLATMDVEARAKLNISE